MTSKKKIYVIILAATVVAIWGKIILEIVNSRMHTDPQIKSETIWVAPLIISSDTLSHKLVLNYPDPFLKESIRPVATVSVPIKRENRTKPKTAPEKMAKPPAWPEFTYLGRMKRPNEKDGFAILLHKNEEYIIARGDTVLNCQVKSVFSDSVIIAMNGQTKTLKK